MKTIDMTYAGRTVSLPDLPDYRKFYAKLGAGTWEPHTFDVLRRNLDRDIVYVDIGAWIGVTPFWASGLARKVLAIEPDPKCIEILRQLAPAHDNVTVIHAALASESDVTIHAVDGFGSSETSILDIGDGDSVKVQGLGMDRIMQEAGPGPVFVKIDIEGYEFAMASEIARLQAYDLAGLQLAVHPQLLEKSLRGPRLWRRLLAAWKVWRLSRVLGGLFPAPRLTKYPSVFDYVLKGVLLRDVPRGADFIFERIRPHGPGERE
jgi:FkbM family methyltransferase